MFQCIPRLQASPSGGHAGDIFGHKILVDDYIPYSLVSFSYSESIFLLFVLKRQTNNTWASSQRLPLDRSI